MNVRLDMLLVDRGLASSIKEAHGFILAGKVFVENALSDKPGNQHPRDAEIRIKDERKFVSRGGLKLDAGLDHFAIDVTGFTCIDIGASTGGFTDCLLQRGAGKVYAVDVAYGQFSWKLRQDKRVKVIERFNARNLSKTEIIEPVDLVVIDASFISLTKLLPPLPPLFRKKIRIIALVKPQFELPKNKVENGVVVDTALHEEAVNKIQDFANSQLNLKSLGIVTSPILGPKGNTEFVLYLTDSI